MTVTLNALERLNRSSDAATLAATWTNRTCLRAITAGLSQTDYLVDEWEFRRRHGVQTRRSEVGNFCYYYYYHHHQSHRRHH